MHSQTQELSLRLERLERENRRMKRIGAVAATVLGVLALAGAAAPLCDIVTGERLVLRDESGRSRVTIDAYHVEQPSIAFHDKAGKAIARLGVDKNGDAFLATYDARGATRGNWTFTPETQKTPERALPEGKRDDATLAQD